MWFSKFKEKLVVNRIIERISKIPYSTGTRVPPKFKIEKKLFQKRIGGKKTFYEIIFLTSSFHNIFGLPNNFKNMYGTYVRLYQ